MSTPLAHQQSRPPVAEALDEELELHIAHDVDRAPFAEREVVRRVERLGREIAKGAAPARLAGGECVGGSQRIAVILDEPEPVLAAKGGQAGEVKWIPQCMRHHHRLGLAGAIRSGDLVDAGIQGEGIIIDKHRHGADLQDGGHGGREAACHGDHLVPLQEAMLVGELRAGERRDGEEIGRGAGVHQEGTAHAELGGKLLFKRIALFAESEPKIERGADRRRDFIGIKHSCRIRDRIGNAVIRGCRSRERAAMHHRGILASEVEDLLTELFGRGGHAGLIGPVGVRWASA